MAMSPERITQRAAARKSEKEMRRLSSVAHLCTYHQAACIQTLTVRLNSYAAADVQPEEIVFRGSDAVKLANEFLPKMGWKPVRLTRNMLNFDSPMIVIDIDTPSCCDPGCGAYHSM